MNQAANYLIRPNWETLLMGIENKYLSVPKCEELAYEIYDNDKNYTNDLIGLSVENDDEEEFVKVLRKISLKYAHNVNVPIEQLLKISIRQWELAYLRMILDDCNMSDRQKLIKIDIYWETFDHREAWKDFIYMLPPKDNKPLGEKGLIKKANDFAIMEEKNILNLLNNR